VRELLLPIGVFFILGSMLLPLPSIIIDIFLIGNLILSFILFIGSVLIAEPLKLSAFPTILLLVTLYRLSLNVSTTRLILGGESAGEVVGSFGSIVIGGNIVVGVVVFLIITLVQFIVVAKGAERVAEVSARFTLDAMPGKQMSIDADIRSGLVSLEEGQRRRQELQIESRFYGALDGSMKFVKGDAIAGIIITGINIIGGFLCGVFVEQMDIREALNHFTLLTVGDGLLSQVPAFMNSLAAGVLVTRVARGDGMSLAIELPSQIAEVKYAGVFTVLLALVLTFIVGLPAVFFIVIPIALAIFRVSVEAKKKAVAIEAEPMVQFSIPTPSNLKMRLPVSFREDDSKLRKIGNSIENIRQSLFEELGILVEPPKVECLNSSEEIEIWVFNSRVAHFSVNEEWEGVFTTQLNEIVRIFRMELLTDLHTRRLINFYEQSYPEVLAHVIPDVLSVTQLTRVLKALLREGVPIRNFILIIQALSEGVISSKSPEQLLEDVRIALGREISAQVMKGAATLCCVTLDPEVDSEIGLAMFKGEQPDIHLLDSVASAVTTVGADIRALICSNHSRAAIKALLQARGEDLPVLSYEEVVGQPLTVMGEIPYQNHHSDEGSLLSQGSYEVR
jgi:flagellar biosynthesis component FlhA